MGTPCWIRIWPRVFRLSKAVLRGMMKARKRSASSASPRFRGSDRKSRTGPTLPPAKGRNHRFHEVAAREVGIARHTVNAIAPGLHRPPTMTRGLVRGAARRRDTQINLGRLASRPQSLAAGCRSYALPMAPISPAETIACGTAECTCPRRYAPNFVRVCPYGPAENRWSNIRSR